MGALRDPRFRCLFVGWSLSNFGDSALYLSLAIWAKDLTGSNAAAGLVFFALAVPVFLSPVSGHVADRVRRRPLLIGANVVGAVMVLSLLAVSSVAQLWILYAVAFGYGVLGTVIGSAQSGLLKDLLPDADLAAANAALSTVDQGQRIVSPLVGAAVYAAYGGGALALLASATFLAAVSALCTVRIAESDPKAHPREQFRREFTAGFRHVRATPLLWRLVVAVALAFAVIGIYDSVIFAVVEQGLGREPAFFGVLMSLQGAGSIVGGLTAAALIGRIGEARTVGVAFGVFAVSSAGFAAPSLSVVAPASVLGGVAIPWLIIGFVTARQRYTPPRLQGRVSAVTLLSMNGPQTVSIAIGAVLVSVVDYRALVAVSALVIAASGVWLLRTPSVSPSGRPSRSPLGQSGPGHPRQGPDHCRSCAPRMLPPKVPKSCNCNSWAVTVPAMTSRTRLLRAAIGAALALTTGLAAAGCSSGEPAAAADGKLRIVTTVAPITSIVSSIGGDRVSVTGLVPEGTNSHTFDPPPSAAVVLSDADIVFVNGLRLEEPTLELTEQNMQDGSVLVEIGTEVIPESDWIYDFSFPREEGKPNPHLWTDPTYAIEYAAVARDTLVAADADNADYYETNYTAFEEQATALSNALRADQESIPDGQRELLTYHDAYAYFARTYDWTVIGAIQPENFSDPTPREVAALIDQIIAEDVPVIFGSEVFPSDVLEEVGRATGARYEDTLRDDDLPGEPGDPEHSWAGLMRYDYVTMIEGLGGTADELPGVDTSPSVPDEADYPQ